MEDHKDNPAEEQTEYFTYCLAIGTALGASIGSATDNLALCMAIFVSIGVAVGQSLDSRRETEEE